MEDEWRPMSLGDVVRLQRGHDLPDKDRHAGTVPVMGSFGITGWHNEARAAGPGVTIGRSGASIGVVSFVDQDYWPLNTCLYVTDFLGNDPRFCYYWLKTLDLASYNSGSAQPSLNRNYIYGMPVRVPSDVDEQRAIAHILGTLDDKIELNRRMNETLEAIARAIFKSWFVDFDPVRAKASGESPESICRRLGLTPDLLALFPDRFVESELGEIPDGWEVKAVGDVANVVKGKSYKSSELAPSKTALVTLKSFNRGGGYRLDGLKEYTGSYKSGQEVFGGDLVVAYTDVTQAADVIGKPALVISDDAYDHLVISLDVAVVRPVRDEYRIFLYGVMSDTDFQQHTRAHTTGTTVLHLASSAVPGFRFKFPGDGLVDAYASIARPMFASIDERVAEGRTLTALRDTLLPKLVSGELRVPVAGAL